MKPSTRQPTTERATDASKDVSQSDLMARLNAKWEKEAQEAKTGVLAGTITNMRAATAGEIYGDKAKDASRPVINVEITASDGKKFHETFSQPEGAGSWRNSKFKMGQFLAKYGVLPSEGVAVQIGFDNDGFYRLIL